MIGDRMRLRFSRLAWPAAAFLGCFVVISWLERGACRRVGMSRVARTTRWRRSPVMGRIGGPRSQYDACFVAIRLVVGVRTPFRGSRT